MWFIPVSITLYDKENPSTGWQASVRVNFLI